MPRGSRGIQVGYVLPQPAVDPHYPQYMELRDAAKAAVRARRGSVDPVDLHRINTVLGQRPHDWAISVLGYPYSRSCSCEDLQMLLVAHDRGITPPLPEPIARARAEAQAKRDAERKAYEQLLAALGNEWDALVKAMPVPVGATHNYESHRHYENYVQGGDHIVVREDLHRGRLRRQAFTALCATPSYAHNLYLPFAREPRHDNAWPNCKTCIRTACRITGLKAPALLGQR